MGDVATVVESAAWMAHDNADIRIDRFRPSPGGRRRFPMHELRHTAGNEFRRATGDRELTRLFMRLASISTTSEHCMHADKSALIAGMRQLEQRWEKE